MANDYYTESGTPAQSSQGASSTMRTEFVSVRAGFDKLAPITANANNFVVINASATAQSAITPAAARTALSLVVGTDVQAYNANLAALSGLVGAADQMIYFTGVGTMGLATITTFGRSVVAGVSAAAVRTTLGAVSGPVSSTSGNIATFNGTGGNTLQDGSAALSTDGTLASNSDAKIPTEKAVKTYVASNIFSAATQADQQTATSTTLVVTPGRQQFHPSNIKMWCEYNTVTSTTIRSSYNVSSLTDNGVGLTTVNFTNAFSSGNYGFTLGIIGATAGSDVRAWAVLDGTGGSAAPTTKTSSALKIATGLGGAAPADVTYISVACYGDLA